MATHIRSIFDLTFQTVLIFYVACVQLTHRPRPARQSGTSLQRGEGEGGGGGQEAVSSQVYQKAEPGICCRQQLTRVVPAVTPRPRQRAVEGAVQVVDNPRGNEHVVKAEVGQDDLGGEADT